MMATCNNDGPMEPKSITEFLSNIKLFLEKEEKSTKLTTFGRMLKRMPDTSMYGEFRFEVDPEDLYARKSLFVERILFVKNMPWRISFEPSSTSIAHSIGIKCCHPSILWEGDFEINAIIKINSPKPIPFHTQKWVFRKAADVLVVSDCVPHAKLQSAKVNKNKKMEFSVKIDVISEKRRMIFDTMPSRADPKTFTGCCEVLRATAPAELSLRPQEGAEKCKVVAAMLLSSFVNLFSEESMKLSTSRDWFRIFLLLCDFNTNTRVRRWSSVELRKQADAFEEYIGQSGFVNHIVYLMKADFSQPKWCGIIPSLLLSIAYDQFTNIDKQVVPLIQTLIGKLKDKNSGTILIARIILDVLPNLIGRESYEDKSKHSMDAVLKLTDHLEFMNDCLSYKHLTPLAQFNLIDPILEASILQSRQGLLHLNLNSSEKVWGAFNTFYQFLCLTVIGEGKLQALPIPIAKKFLVTLVQNKINPNFEVTAPAFSFNNLTKMLRKRSTKELVGFWLNLLGANAAHNPLLFDLVPADIEVEVPFTSDCGSLDYAPLDVPTRMPVYFTIYTKYVETVMKPLKNCYFERTVTFSIPSIEKLKNEGNKYHNDRNFKKAIEIYDHAIEHIMVAKLSNRSMTSVDERFQLELLLTVCRSNRVSSCLELGRYEDAVVDATITLREIHGLLDGDESEYWDIVENPDTEQTLIKREATTRLKRIKALTNLKQWGQVLENIQKLLNLSAWEDKQVENVKEQAIGYYYNASVQYMKEFKTVFYPLRCVCYEWSAISGKIKCKQCMYPYCSKECKKKDNAIHSKYCSLLKNLYGKYGSGYK